MIATAFVFAFVTALLELIILWKFVPIAQLEKTWVKAVIHFGMFAINLAVHFGTIVGTMTAITAALVSFVTVPAVIWTKHFVTHFLRA